MSHLCFCFIFLQKQPLFYESEFHYLISHMLPYATVAITLLKLGPTLIWTGGKLIMLWWWTILFLAKTYFLLSILTSHEKWCKQDYLEKIVFKHLKHLPFFTIVMLIGNQSLLLRTDPLETSLCTSMNEWTLRQT
jgi:hypothetical protein